jgi:transcriptional regulator with XRE-family HTH domain
MRQRREEQGISLVAIAEQTKIKRSLLDALEHDDVTYWPAGFFGRAFIRAYAQAIGLNPDDVVREFLEAHPEPVEEVAATAANGGASDGGLRSMVESALVGSLGRLRRVTPSPAFGPAPTLPPARPAPPLGRRHVESAKETSAKDVDFEAVAELCTDFTRVHTTDDLQRLLQQVGAILDATGLIVWVWDEASSELKPALAYGYADAVLAQLPAVTRDTNNATAAAFRSHHINAVDPTDRARGALAVPLLTRSGCVGVLAIELHRSAEHTKARRAAATIFAAAITQLIAT